MIEAPLHPENKSIRPLPDSRHTDAAITQITITYGKIQRYQIQLPLGQFNVAYNSHNNGLLCDSLLS